MKSLFPIFLLIFLLRGLSVQSQEIRIPDQPGRPGSLVKTQTPNNGYPTHRDESIWQESDWQPMSHTEVTYDSDGKVTSEIITYTNGEQYWYQYSSDEGHDYTYCRKYTGEEWELFYREVTDFDPATGIEYHCIREINVDGFWHKVLEWNALLEFLEGRLGRRTVSEYNQETQQLEYTNRYTYTYNESGLCSSMTTEKYTDGNFVNDLKEDYTWLHGFQYDQVLVSHWTGSTWFQNGKYQYNWIDGLSYMWTYSTRLSEASPWSPFLRLTDRFDERGNQVEYLQERYMDQLWTLTFGSQYSLTYEGTNLTEKIAHDWQSEDEEWVNAYRIVYSDFLNLGTGNELAQSLQMNCYPNPTGEQIRIEVKSDDGAEKSIELMDLNGQTLRKEILATGDNTLYWSLSDLPGGIYLVRLSQPDQSPVIQKIIKK